MFFKRILISVFFFTQPLQALSFEIECEKIMYRVAGGALIYVGVHKLGSVIRKYYLKRVPVDVSKKYEEKLKYYGVKSKKAINIRLSDRGQAYLVEPWARTPTFVIDKDFIEMDEDLQSSVLTHEAQHYHDRKIISLGCCSIFLCQWLCILSFSGTFWILPCILLITAQKLFVRHMEFRADDFMSSRIESRKQGELFANDLENDEEGGLQIIKSYCNNTIGTVLIRNMLIQTHPSGIKRAQRIRKNLDKRFGKLEKAE